MIKINDKIRPLLPKILAIEDDTDFNNTLCVALRKNGYEVFSAVNGKQGLDLFERNLTDLVITDILMPERDGVEVISTLKKNFPNVKIIAISGGGSGGTGQDYLDSVQMVCNVRHTLAKPFRKDELFQMIQEVLHQ